MMTQLTAFDYALHILGTMRDAPDELVEEALHSLGVDRTRMLQANDLVEQQNFATTPAFDIKCNILAPAVREDVRTIQGRECTLRSFKLPLWKDYLLDIYGTADGLVGTERFSRAPGQERPHSNSPDELAPWSITIEEVEEHFGPLQEEFRWPPYESYVLHYQTGKYDLVFSWGLLQSVTKSSS